MADVVSRNSVVVSFESDGSEKLNRDIKNIQKSSENAGKSVGSATKSVKDLGSSQNERGVSRLSRAFNTLSNNAGKILTGGLVAGTTALLATIRATANTADEFAKMSARVDVSVESLSQYKFALEQSGSSINTFERGLQNLTRNLSTASQGSGQTAESFRKLGIEVTDSEGNLRRSESVMLDVANAFQNLENGADKSALAMQIFGQRAGPELINFLNAGEDGIASLRSEADALGATISTETARQAEELNDALNSIATFAKGAGLSIASSLIPSLSNVAVAFANGSKEGNFFTAIMSGLTASARELAIAILPLSGLDLLGITLGAEKELEAVNARLLEIDQTLSNISSGRSQNLFGMNDFRADSLISESLELQNRQIELENEVTEIRQSAEIERQRLLEESLQAQIDAQNAYAEQVKAINDDLFNVEAGGQDDRVLFDQAQIDQEAEALRRMIDPLRELTQQRERMIEVAQNSDLSESELAQALEINAQKIEQLNPLYSEMQRIKEQAITDDERLALGIENLNNVMATGEISIEAYNFELRKLQEEFANTSQLSQQMGQVLVSSFSSFAGSIISGASTVEDAFANMIQSMIQQIIQLIIQWAIATALGIPLGGGGGIISGGIFSFFADGGVMTSSGSQSLPSNAYANGGIANSPQVAVFGEGSRPEAFVPLPDGRTIPVTMSGSGGHAAQTNNNISINVQAQDVDSFARSENQILTNVAFAVRKVADR